MKRCIHRPWRQSTLFLVALGSINAIATCHFVRGADQDVPGNIASHPYQPRSLKGISPKQMLDWMNSGDITRVDPLGQRMQDGLPPVDIWTGSVEEVIRIQFERARKAEVNARNSMQFSGDEKALPASGVIKYRMVTTTQVEGTRLLTLALRWDPAKSWVALAEDQNVATQEPYVVTDKFGLPLLFAEISPTDARRLARLILATGRASTPIKGRTIKRPSEQWFGVAGHSWPSFLAMRLAGDRRKPILSKAAQTGGGVEVYEEMRRRERGEKEDIGWTNARALEFARKWLLEELPYRLSIEKASHLDSSIWGYACPAAYKETLMVLTPFGVDWMRQAATRVLQATVDQPTLMPRNITTVAIITAGELGLSELSGQIDAIAATLPKPSAWELRRDHLNAELASVNLALLSSQEPGVAELVRREKQYWSDKESVKLAASYQEPTRLLLGRARSVYNALEKLKEQTARDEPDRSVADERRAITLVRRQFSARDNQGALATWAISTDHGADWAYRRLRAINPDAANDAAESRLSVRLANIELYDFARNYLKEAPERARKFLQGIPEIRRNQLTTLEGVFGEPATMKELLAVVIDSSQKEADRNRALSGLVPSEFPNLYPNEDIDEALAMALKVELDSGKDLIPGNTAGEIRASDSLAFRLGSALMWRNPVRHWNLVASVLLAMESRKLAGADPYLLNVLVPGAMAKPDSFGCELHRLVAERLKDADSIENFLATAWLCDFRDLRDQIAALGTSGQSSKNVSDDKDVNVYRRVSRAHLARQIASIWDEPDAVTRVQMLTAFVLGRYLFDGLEDSMWDRLQCELNREISALSPGERTAILNYYDQLSSIWLEDEVGREPESLEKVARIRNMLSTDR
jgi:hypothetical protein